MACSSTLQPISRSCGVALSISLWLMPSSQGTKIMPVGATVQTWQASCPAPETMSRWSYPKSAAASRTASTHRGSNRIGGLSQICSTATSTPARCAMPANESRIPASIAARASASGWRISTENRTCPGMVFREFGLTSSWPTVPTACGAFSSAISSTRATIRAAAASASFRAGIGVVPACESRPRTSTSYQRCPWAPPTTPMGTPACSRIGPCSIWASNRAPRGCSPQGSAPL